MMLIRWCLFIITRGALAHIQKPLESQNSAGVDTTMINLLKSCYRNYTASNPILLLGDIDNCVGESVFKTRPISIISMNGSLQVYHDHGKKSSHDFKPNIIVLEGDSPEKLQSDLLSLRITQWWNYTAHFFILGKIQHQCEKFSEILNATREVDIMMSIYICLNSQNISELYTLNPITSYAPAPWEKIESSVDLNIYRQLFDSNISCKNLDYDKTKFLNGYGITCVAGHPTMAPNVREKNDSTPSSIVNLGLTVFQVIVTKLNASFVIAYESPGDPSIQRLANGTADVLVDLGFIEWNPERQFLFPCMWDQVMLARKSDGYLTTLEKIDNLWSIPIRLLALFTLSIFFLVLVRENAEISSAFLEMIRLLSYVSIRMTRKKLSFRIFFAMILMFMIISNGVFQGSISAFLTKPQYARGIDTIEEVKELNYTIYTHPGTAKRAKDVCPDNPVIEIFTELCPEFLWNTSRAVCVTVKEFYYEKWADLPMTLIKEPARTSFFNNKCRDDWPLHERVNNIFVRLVESGLFNHWLTKKSHVPMLKRRANDMGLLLPKYQPVELIALDFVFELLGIGLSLATVVFLLELICAEFSIKS